jgi:acyl carrier protein
MAHEAIVREVASALGLLDDRGLLAPLDSFAVVELLLGLERRLGRRIPVTGLTLATFDSLETIGTMLDALGG